MPDRDPGWTGYNNAERLDEEETTVGDDEEETTSSDEEFPIA